MAKTEIFTIGLDAEQYLRAAKQTQDEIERLSLKQNELRKNNQKNSKEWIENATAIKGNKTALLNLKKTIISLESPYAKLSNKLIRAKKEAKDLSVEFGINSKQATKARVSVLKLDAQLKKIDSSLGDNQRRVGGYSNALKGMATQFIGWSAVVFGVIRGLKDIANRIVLFDKQMTGLSAILKVNREDLQGLEEEIKNVAGASINTSTEVAELATTLATLGKSKEEIIQLLKPVNDLAIGLEATSEEAGQLLIKTLNAFGESGKEAGRYADIIAKMRTSTALDFEQIKDSLGFLAPIAKVAGVSFEETGAMLGVLVDNGIKAARAGRLTSTAFLKLATDGKTLTQALDEINKAQSEGKKETELLTIASGLFGKQSAAIGIILADNRDRTKELTTEFENAGGALKDLTDKQLESLDAQLKILDSTWEKFILNIENGDGALSKLVSGIVKLTTKGISNISDFSTQFSIFQNKNIGVIDKMKVSINQLSQGFLAFSGLGNILNSLGFDAPFTKATKELVAYDKMLTSASTSVGVMTKEQDKLNKSTEKYFNILDHVPEEKTKDPTKKELAAASKLAKDKLNASVKSLSVELDLYREQNREKLEIDGDLNVALVNAKIVTLEQINQKENEALDFKLKNGLLKEGEYNLAKLTLENDFQADKKELTDNLATQEEADRVAKLEKDRSDRQIEFELQLEENAIKQQTEHERKLAADALNFENDTILLQERLDNKEISQEESDRRLEILQETHNANLTKLNIEHAKKNELIEKAKELNKVNALSSGLQDAQALLSEFGVESQMLSIGFATADMFLGIQKAYLSQLIPGDPTSLPRAILAGAQAGAFGLANVTKIAGVKFEDGGMLTGASHAGGGINIEAEGGEAVINKRSMSDPFLRGLASDINEAGGGVKFADGGVIGQSSINSLVSSGGSSSQQINDLIDNRIANIKVVNVATETAAVNNEVIEVENVANL